MHCCKCTRGCARQKQLCLCQKKVPLTPVVEYKADNHQKRKLKKEAVQKDEAKRAKKKTHLEQKLDEYLVETFF